MRGLRGFAGVCLVGYGLLVALRIIAHESLGAGLISLVLGAGLLASIAWSSRTTGASRAPLEAPPLRPTTGTTRARGLPLRSRAWWVGALGATMVASVVAYNALVGSGLSTPEWGLVGYGLALTTAAPFLASGSHRERVAEAVGWSFPLLLTPLVLYAIHGIISGPAGLQTAGLADPIIHYTLTLPTAALLAVIGTASHVIGNNLILATPRGSLTLGVGLVCAGIYPTVLFLGVLAMHGWRERLVPRRFAAYLGLGLAGLYAANLLRLIVLAKVGQVWGGTTLQQVHAHLGWILFVGFMLVFWGLVLRRWERPAMGSSTTAR